MTFIPIMNVQYRLSRRYTGGDNTWDNGNWNNIVCFSKHGFSSNPYFVEGFNARSIRYEGYANQWSHRKGNVSPAMDYEYHWFDVAGDEKNDPMLRERLSLTPAVWDLNIDMIRNSPMECTLRYCNAAPGEDVDAFNCTDSGNNSNVNFYHKDFLRVPSSRNICYERDLINAAPHNHITGGVLYQTRSNK